jgi:large subunit ribosomal protein L10
MRHESMPFWLCFALDALSHREEGVFVRVISEERRECRLAINRQKKEELVVTYKELLKHSPALVFTNYKGTKVSQLRALRVKLKETNTTYVVVKNTLLGIALKESGRVVPEQLLNGTNGVAFLGEDIGKSVTALNDWIKSAKVLEVTGALLESSVVQGKAAEELANLPTKEQTRAMLLGAISAPARSLVQIINAPGASLARVINAHVEPKEVHVEPQEMAEAA